MQSYGQFSKLQVQFLVTLAQHVDKLTNRTQTFYDSKLLRVLMKEIWNKKPSLWNKHSNRVVTQMLKDI